VSIWAIIIKYREGLQQGLLVTLELCLIIWGAGIVGGSLLGVAGAKWKSWIGVPSRIISFVLSGIPVLVFLFWLHYPLQAELHVVIPPFYTAAAALSLLNVVAVADLVRAVLRDFPQQYIVAAQVCGLTHKDIVLRIQLPIVLRQIIPGLLTLQVNMLQVTIFASLISVDEIFRVTQRINAEIYQPVEVFTALGVFFLAICLPMNGLALWLRMRFTRDVSEN